MSLSDKYALDLLCFHKRRKFKDGIDFFKWEAHLELYEADHHPLFVLHLVLCNCTIFELNVYSKEHVKG